MSKLINQSFKSQHYQAQGAHYFGINILRLNIIEIFKSWGLVITCSCSIRNNKHGWELSLKRLLLIKIVFELFMEFFNGHACKPATSVKV